MMLLKRIVMVVPDPGESAEHGDEDEGCGQDSSRDDGDVLNGLGQDDIDNLVHEPAKKCQSGFTAIGRPHLRRA